MFSRLRKTLPLLPCAIPFVYNWHQQQVNCCGIIGVLTTKQNAEQVVMEGVHLLENRGYDSAGIVSIKDDKLVVSKYASDPVAKVDCFEKIQKELNLHQGSAVGVGHTRWATCGSKVDMNAHPHVDMSGRAALVHNGTLENYQELKAQLMQDHNVKFTSETDTEVIVQWIGLLLNQGLDLLEATKQTLAKLHGQWGLVVIDRVNPDVMVVCRNGSPILVGYNESSIYAASEKIAFEKYTSTYITLKDGEIMQLKLSERNNFYNQVRHRMKTLEQSSVPIAIKPTAPYKSFFEQEIFEQPSSTLRTLGNGGRLAGSNESPKLGGLEQVEDDVCAIRNLVLLGCGSSYLAAQSVMFLYKQLQIFDTVTVIEASEFNSHDIPKINPGVVVISQSGETKDLITAVEHAKNAGAFSIGIVNVVGSVLGTECDTGIFLNCGREVGVAASKSFTSQVEALILLGLWLSYHKEKKSKTTITQKHIRVKSINQLRSLPMSIGQALHECRESVIEVAKVLIPHQHLLILGKGPCAAIAKEGALKIKELTYKHAEGFSAGELKHGPLALIDQTNPKSMPIILIILDNENINEMKLALSEVHSRNALTIVISDCPEKLSNDKSKIHHLIPIPSIGAEVGWLVAVLPFQLLALEICTLINVNPDKPRNLAKTVTVG